MCPYKMRFMAEEQGSGAVGDVSALSSFPVPIYTL